MYKRQGLLKYGVQSVDKRANALGQEALLDQAQDPYATFREAYLQGLEYRVNDGKSKAVQETLSQDELNDID